MIRQHVKTYHNHAKHTCPECGRDFKSRTKLKHHRLSHSDVREFLCHDCGRQFKRKDKLREHILGNHSPEARRRKEAEAALTAAAAASSSANGRRSTAANDYHRFVYKCHDCRLGFKRRGMLVNHMAKRHPDVNVDTVPELTMPILQTQRFYYCQYCDKVYKSSGKRKLHILKNHPGLELPQPTRRKKVAATANDVNDADPVADNAGSGSSFSEMVGNVTAMAQRCLWCHKQYSNKARLLQHERKEHSDQLQTESTPIGPPGIVSPTEVHTYQPYDCGDNKLLRLSSAAMEASLQDDYEYYNHHSDELHGTVSSDYETKIDGNYKVIDGDNDDYLDNGRETTTGDLSRLPSQLFDDLNYIHSTIEMEKYVPNTG